MIASSNGTSEATGESTITVNTFRFQIYSGTGQYARDRGTGMVQIEITPRPFDTTGTIDSNSSGSGDPGRYRLGDY